MKEFLSTWCPVEWLSLLTDDAGWTTCTGLQCSFHFQQMGLYNSQLEKTHSCAWGQASVYPSSFMSPVVTHPSVTGGLSEASHLRFLALHSLLSGFSGCLPARGSKPALLSMAHCYFFVKEQAHWGPGHWNSKFWSVDGSLALLNLTTPQSWVNSEATERTSDWDINFWMVVIKWLGLNTRLKNNKTKQNTKICVYKCA